jgi:hypothetical protein
MADGLRQGERLNYSRDAETIREGFRAIAGEAAKARK